jgi:predicted CxxxxCH...CXXCH cytochrome family protein
VKLHFSAPLSCSSPVSGFCMWNGGGQAEAHGRPHVRTRPARACPPFNPGGGRGKRQPVGQEGTSVRCHKTGERATNATTVTARWASSSAIPDELRIGAFSFFFFFF